MNVFFINLLIVCMNLQLYFNDNNVKILACAPSNAAADVIALRLLEHIPKKAMLRLNAASRSM